MENSQSLQLLC